MIVDDDESNIPSFEGPAVSTSVDASADENSPFALSNPNNPPAQEAWYDVEDDRYGYEDLQPSAPLELEGFGPLPTQDQPRSCQHSEEPATHHLHIPLEKDGAGDQDVNVSELERDMLLAFEGQQTSSATPLSSQPPQHALKLPPLKIDLGSDQIGTDYGGSEEPKNESQLHGQDTQGPDEAQGQSPQEGVVEAILEVEDDESEAVRAEQSEKRPCPRKEEAGIDIRPSEGSACNNTIDERTTKSRRF